MKLEDLYKALSKPIEEKYLVEYTEDGKTFTGYKAIGAINRLNEVIGIDNWYYDFEIRTQEFINGAWAVAYTLKLNIVIKDDQGNEKVLWRTGSGGAYAKSIANAYKGAQTSAFKNACKWFGIGKELYEQNQGDSDIESVPDKTSIPEWLDNMIKKIQGATSMNELKEVEQEIKNIEAKNDQTIVMKTYNDKKRKLLS